ncbi:hypothetical protein C7453_10564 [Gluconacetobacter liquefaciens]|uniref:Uncharacterized protein n=1 Tax=Gluconacetobacter liquefaciens TaxID=89584 RepID=A0A370G3Q7_GLULI|nr:hypothetical protein C7453_10564 [Gluconacetobacter liquefaciens]
MVEKISFFFGIISALRRPLSSQSMNHASFFLAYLRIPSRHPKTHSRMNYNFLLLFIIFSKIYKISRFFQNPRRGCRSDTPRRKGRATETPRRSRREWRRQEIGRPVSRFPGVLRPTGLARCRFDFESLRTNGHEYHRGISAPEATPSPPPDGGRAPRRWSRQDGMHPHTPSHALIRYRTSGRSSRCTSSSNRRISRSSGLRRHQPWVG